MNYVRYVNNAPYLTIPGEPPQAEHLINLVLGKVYKAIPDRAAERQGMMRVIDETYGEPGSENGYLYPAEYFHRTATERCQRRLPYT